MIHVKNSLFTEKSEIENLENIIANFKFQSPVALFSSLPSVIRRPYLLSALSDYRDTDLGRFFYQKNHDPQTPISLMQRAKLNPSPLIIEALLVLNIIRNLSTYHNLKSLLVNFYPPARFTR